MSSTQQSPGRREPNGRTWFKEVWSTAKVPRYRGITEVATAGAATNPSVGGTRQEGEVIRILEFGGEAAWSQDSEICGRGPRWDLTDEGKRPEAGSSNWDDNQ